jgi:serine/threonine protein kinase
VKLRPHGRLGSYELESAIGEGGLGEVWKAHDTSSGRLIALRILPAPPPGDPFRFARFDEDIRKLMALRHPNVARVYELIDGDGVRALACEWIDGDSLAKRIAAGPIPVDDVTRIIAQVANGLAAAHARDLLHGDIKPSNIALCPDGVVKVVDLGLVEIYDRGDLMNSSDGRPAPSARLLGAITGTAAYMSPEQIAGHAADSRADVWAFGCVLYEMLTGKPAFGGDDVSDTMARVTYSEPEWALIPPTTPVPLVDVLRRCLKKDAAQRFPRMPDVLASIKMTTGEEEDDMTSELEKQLPSLKRWSRGRLPSSLDLDANVLVEETIAQAKPRLGHFRPRHPGALSAYLRQSVLNRIRDEIRRQRRSGEEAADDVLDMTTLDRYRDALERLSERDRALIERRIEKGDAYDDIARRFPFPSVAAARVAVVRAVKRLAELLAKVKKDR